MDIFDVELKGGVVLEIVHETNIGFIYDVCQVIICKTAKREGWINSYVMEGREEADVEQLDKTLSQFEDIDPVWNIITLLHPKKGRILSKLCVDFMREAKESSRNKDFIDYLSTPDLLKNIICDWYFDTTDISELDCFYMLHRNSNLDQNTKLYLYDFFASPTEYIVMLQQSMQKVVYDMEAFYQKHIDILTQKQNKFVYLTPEQEEMFFPSSLTWNKMISRVIISFSLINRYTAMRDEYSNEIEGWILLGIDYDVEMSKLENPVNLIGFGNALGDPTRLKILKEIHRNGEQTLTDLSKKFNLVNAVTLYHLDILKRERILGQRHEGRRIYYWLNYSRLERFILAIITEFGGEKYENMEKTFFGKNE